MVTKESLIKERAELQKAYDDALAQMNAFGGALQFCDHLISEFDEPEKGAGEEPAPVTIEGIEKL